MFVIYDTLPSKAKNFKKQPVFYEQNRPKFRVELIHKNKKYDFWFPFDTGHDGAMIIREDFTSIRNDRKEFLALTTVNGRKIILLDALIGDLRFKDIVTNAVDPLHPNGISSLFGNQILSHFNVILDNRNGFIYLKKNLRSGEPYFNYD